MGSAGQVERVFLGGDGPALPAAAHWLIQTLGGESADLGAVLVVLPGGRAQRRLMELLAQRTAGRAMIPPTMITLGGLLDRLIRYEDQRVTSGLPYLLAWAEVLREAPPELLGDVLPNPPGRDDWPGWWAFAEQVTDAANELAAQHIVIPDVADRVMQPEDASRWRALGRLSDQVRGLLEQRGLAEPHSGRLDAIQAGQLSHDGPVVLIGTADLQPVHVAAIAGLSTQVHALIAADAGDAQGFDEYGRIEPAYWSQRPIVFDDDAMVVADRPGDQALAVYEAMRGWASEDPLSPDAVTVGLGDESLSGPVMRTLELAGVPVRSASGRALSGSRPVQLMRALAAFVSGQRFDQLANLLRHPDAEEAITRAGGESVHPWLTLLDRYATDHLAARPVEGWLGEQSPAMDAVFQAARALMPEPGDVLRPLPEWTDAIGQALDRVYGHRTYQRHSPDDRPVVEALKQFGEALEQLVSLEADQTPRTTFAQAVELVLSMLGKRAIPEPGGQPAVELVGYLELLLDDAPRLAVVGMNEQHVPAPPRHSALLSDGVRLSLSLPGDEHRLARDAYSLSAMLSWRRGAKLIAGRRSAEGDPLLPSRILLKTDDARLVQRVSDFVAEQEQSPQTAVTLLAPGGSDRFLIPQPVLPPDPITRLSVTAFRDYLACPYRFYLRHVLRLRVLDDRAIELSAANFGTLTHDALRVLAQPCLADVDDPQIITQHLSAALDHVVGKTYGSDPPVAARLQAEQARYRLNAFACRHAEMIAGGWRIAHHEHKADVQVQVDGQPFFITGRIDRIDRHPDGLHRLIDYKTSDTAKSPEQAHHKREQGVKTWADLQLPIYIDLARSLGIEDGIEVGYINLPKNRDAVGYTPARWCEDELEEARLLRDDVIRKVRAGVFWPPKEPPRFDDGLAWVCADEAADRTGLIQQSSSPTGVADE